MSASTQCPTMNPSRHATCGVRSRRCDDVRMAGARIVVVAIVSVLERLMTPRSPLASGASPFLPGFCPQGAGRAAQQAFQ